jgi:hypothetical protein
MLTSASPLVHIPQLPGPKAPTTAAAVLDELLKLLPPGATSNYALYQGQDQTGAQVYLDGAAGTQMAITAVQAEQIAANPAWGATQMSAALVKDAARRFPGVPAGS